MLFRIAKPTAGIIKINGMFIEKFEIKSLRKLFGYVPQDSTLFSDSILNNITFNRSSSVEEINRLVKIVQLEDEVKKFNNGLNESIGERGIRLSGGQKERVAIARALLGKPKILILDDATCSLDAETEKELIKEIMIYMKNSTLIIVSHRLSILNNCDILYVMDKGEIVEKGTHRELLKKEGLYWKLYQRQLVEENISW